MLIRATHSCTAGQEKPWDPERRERAPYTRHQYRQGKYRQDSSQNPFSPWKVQGSCKEAPSLDFITIAFSLEDDGGGVASLRRELDPEGLTAQVG